MYGNVELKKSNPPLYKDKIDLIRSIIVDSVDKNILKKVYLFGSYAYGKPNGIEHTIMREGKVLYG